MPPLSADRVKEDVLASASKNSVLLSKLASTEEAPGNLALHMKQISRLQDDLKEQNEALDKVKVEVEEKFKIHKKFSDNATRKFLYRASFMQKKFEARAVKGEQEYFSLLAIRSKAEERHLTLQTELGEAEKVEPVLHEKAKEHGDLHARIDELYESLFAGPTPGFDREDSLENRYYAARGNHENVKSKILTARQASRQSKIALNNVKRVARLLETANVEVHNSFLFFDEALYSLSRSTREIEYAQSAILQASDVLQPKSYDAEILKNSIIRTLERAKPPAKTPSNREAYQTTISNAKEQIGSAQSQIESFIESTRRREDNGLEEIRKTARTLEDSRQALQHARMGIFEEVAGFGQAAPAYRECCDRADGFCVLPPPPPEEEDEGSEQAEIDEHTGDIALPGYEAVTGDPGAEEPIPGPAPSPDERPIADTAPPENSSQLKQEVGGKEELGKKKVRSNSL